MNQNVERGNPHCTSSYLNSATSIQVCPTQHPSPSSDLLLVRTLLAIRERKTMQTCLKKKKPSEGVDPPSISTRGRRWPQVRLDPEGKITSSGVCIFLYFLAHFVLSVYFILQQTPHVVERWSPMVLVLCFLLVGIPVNIECFLSNNSIGIPGKGSD